MLFFVLKILSFNIMKKIFVLAALACLAFASCEDIKPDGEGTLGDITDNPMLGDTPTTPLSPNQQKSKLISVGEKLMAECPSNEFQKLADLAEDFFEAYVMSDYDYSAVEDWAEGELEKIYTETDSEKRNGKVLTSEYYVKLVILLSNHSGNFVFGNTGVTVADYNGTKAEFTLNGKKYVAVIEQNGKVTNAIFKHTEKGQYDSYGYEDENGNWQYSDDPITNKYSDTIDITVGVPETINVSITENGAKLADVTFKFTASFTPSGINLTTDNFSTEITARINGYEIVINNVKYDGATGKATYSEMLKKDGTALVTNVVSGDVKIDLVKETYREGNNYDEDIVIEAKIAQNITVAMDILGEIQIIGTCSNALDASTSLELFWDALYSNDSTPDEKTAQRHLNNFNAKFDFGIFYDKGNNRQADVEFDYINESEPAGYDRNGDGVINEADNYHDFELFPIIVFNDGSRYAVEEYFTEKSFGDFIEHVENFADGYCHVFGYFYDLTTKEEY